MSHPHGCVSWNNISGWDSANAISHTLTGVWVEIRHFVNIIFAFIGHTLTGVWVEITTVIVFCFAGTSHPHGCVSWNYDYCYIIWFIASHPHGCVSWNFNWHNRISFSPVTPSRVCELKSLVLRNCIINTPSHPHGCVSWNVFLLNWVCEVKVTPSRVCELKFRYREYFCHFCRHTLTGVWVEISWECKIILSTSVTPSRVCELKSYLIWIFTTKQ